MTKALTVLSPAKINLMLRILGQRDDGYHLLQTYFQLLTWGDEMTFSSLPENKILITGKFNNLKQSDNLIDKAAQLLLPFKKNNNGINIAVKKNIPQGSGLGGGSSNAGTTLRVLNQLWNCQLSQEKLQELAITLGADVPVFVLNQSAMARGIGENLSPFEIECYYYVLTFPTTSIATADVFNEDSLIRDDKAIEDKLIHDKCYWTNSCLPVVLNKFSEVADIYNKLSQLSPVYLSGTGSTLFACFDSAQEADKFRSRVPSNIATIVCKSKINEKNQK